jgi:two-component system response regulator
MAKVILIAEDDKNDAQLLANAIAAAGLENPVVTVPNGVDVIRYLEGHAEFSDRSRFPMPSVVLLDLKMPGFTGLVCSIGFGSRATSDTSWWSL